MSQLRGPVSGGERYSGGKRALLLVVGVLMTLSGLALGLVFIGLLTHELLEHHFAGKSLAEAVLVVAVGTLISGGFATMGVTRVLAGIRGSQTAMPQGFARTDSWYTRNWYAVGLGFWAFWVLGALLFKGPNAVFQAKGDTAARLGWYVLLCYLLLPVHFALHELGHAAVGAVLGFRFVSLRVGWLTTQRDAAGFHVPGHARSLQTCLACTRPCRTARQCCGSAPRPGLPLAR